tara:strand:- start:9667 stop:10098 length:432 start_codon:yes stop_codon:yes gene_type:complete
MTGHIIRLSEEVCQTLGRLYIFEGLEERYSCYTLELPWLGNQRRVSCIPEGEYCVIKRVSQKYGEHFHVLDVPDRDYILIHFGNYNRDTLGCILPGKRCADIDGDGMRDVTSSRATMNYLYKLMPNKWNLKINWRAGIREAIR